MKKIVVFRKNEYMSGGQTFKFYINNKEYLLDTNSCITIDTDDEVLQIYARSQWLKTKIITLNSADSEFKIRIKPFIDNDAVKVIILLSVISVLFMISENDFLDLIARIVLISMMAIYVYTLTFGFRNYLKLEINNAI